MIDEARDLVSGLAEKAEQHVVPCERERVVHRTDDVAVPPAVVRGIDEDDGQPSARQDTRLAIERVHRAA